MIRCNVQIQSTRGKVDHALEVEGEAVCVADAFNALRQQAWAGELFDPQESSGKLVPGYLVIVDNRMVQPWEINDIHIKDGQNLKIVQVVPGG